MQLASISLTDFRNHHQATLEPTAGLTAIIGPNGAGKTNLIEAIGYLATLTSFRGVPGDALVRNGAPFAIVRSVINQDQIGTNRQYRTVEIEAELRLGARDRVLVNRQALKRTRDLLGSVRVTIFSPDDLRLIKSGPSDRRGYLNDTLVAVNPRHDQLLSDLDRVLRQRNVLLKQAGGRLSADVESTLEVWDAKLSDLGEELAKLRGCLVEQLGPLVSQTYDQVAERSSTVRIRYEAPWQQIGLSKALLDARKDDLRRGVTTVGPHRDELVIELDDLPARTHGSQGEQRSLALALRLGSHHLVHQETNTAPILLLDDVFSELDSFRCKALLANLPSGQALLTTTGVLPEGTSPDKVVFVENGATPKLVERVL